MSADLTTTYLGLTLECPLIPSSSPLTGSLASLRMLAELGAGAVVLPSLFEEELTNDNGPGAEVFWSTDDRPGAAASYMWQGPAPGSYDATRDGEANEAQRALFAGDRLCKIN